MAGRLLTVAVLCLTAFGACAEGTPATTAAQPKSRFELLLQRMIPQEKLDRAAGFFGPVTKKYLPVVNRFQDEYRAAAQKRDVIAKYLPQADSALAEAKAMKVPSRFEKEKQDYILMAETFLAVVKFSVATGK